MSATSGECRASGVSATHLPCKSCIYQNPEYESVLDNISGFVTEAERGNCEYHLVLPKMTMRACFMFKSRVL